VDPSVGDNKVIKEAGYRFWTTLFAKLLADPRVDPTSANNYAIRRILRGYSCGIGFDNTLYTQILRDPRVQKVKKEMNL
jgi:hypothetical protein